MAPWCHGAPPPASPFRRATHHYDAPVPCRNDGRLTCFELAHRAALEADRELGDPWDGESASRLLISRHPAADRARLAALLLASIEPTEPDSAAAWDEETARRRAELDAGRLQTIPVADVFAALDQRLER